ncbi:hypothetical protein HK101_000263 [Irineochytrium annulatum]|nr:hypothetical protein HK101_000263 [Irineochytrium annulatum]
MAYTEVLQRASKGADNFVEIYYSRFDTQRHLLHQLYQPENACILWNGNPFAGVLAYKAFYLELPRTVTETKNYDCQPLLGDGNDHNLLVTVSGSARYGEGREQSLKHFSHTFVLMPVVDPMTGAKKHPKTSLTIGSRESQLAMIQTNHVSALLQAAHPGAEFRVLGMTTKGDQILDVALSKIGSKSLFTKELEVALQEGAVDLVVHSLKDLPTTLPPNMTIGAILEREDPRDAVVMKSDSKGKTLEDLPRGSVIGTSSVRRSAQLKRKFPGLVFQDVKLDAPDSPYSALLLANAGMVRMGWKDRISQVLPPETILHAVGQGALAVEVREDDAITNSIVGVLDHWETRVRCSAERAFMRALEGGCSVPLGVWTEFAAGGDGSKKGRTLVLRGCVTSLDGSKDVRGEMTELIPFADKSADVKLAEALASPSPSNTTLLSVMAAPQSNQAATRIAILFGYNGAQFNGLERTKGGRTIEGEILNAVATLTGSTDPSKKVTMPTVETLNAILPETIRIFKVVTPAEGFSARRSCDARTYEFLIPTYSFSPPPPQTGYSHAYQPDMTREELDELFPQSEGPTGSLFKTIKRGGGTIKRRSSTRNVSMGRSPDAVSPPQSPGAVDIPRPGTSAEPNAGGNRISKFFGTITRGRKDNNKKGGLATSPSGTGEKTGTFYRSRSAPAPASRDASLNELLDSEEEEESQAGPVYLDPIDIPVPTEEMLSVKRRYRIAPEQLDMLRHIISIFRGTHNFHNYIPGASYDDDRCYMRILSMEMSEPEVHFGMEWIRVKVQARAFARFQIRRMLGLAILVIRTNTPRAVVANSFGFAQIDIPEAPAIGLICDEVFYLKYNEEPTRTQATRVDFNGVKDTVETFRKNQIHDWIYREEQEYM